MKIGIWRKYDTSLSNAEWNNNSHFTNLNLLQTTGTMIIGNFYIDCHLHLHSISTNELSFNVWMDKSLHVPTTRKLTRRQKAKKYQLIPVPVLEME
jgi:hypothetical protein